MAELLVLDSILCMHCPRERSGIEARTRHGFCILKVTFARGTSGEAKRLDLAPSIADHSHGTSLNRPSSRPRLA